MKTLKVILPMLAILFAIGLSFAFVNATGEDYYVAGYVLINGQPYDVDANCNSQSEENCKVRIQGLEGEFIVYGPNDQPLKSSAPTLEIDDPRP